MTHRLLVLCAVGLAGCAPVPRPVSRIPAPPAPPVPSVPSASVVAQELLESNCAQCHDDESNGRPRFGRDVPLSAELALRAATSIAAERMPPFPATLEDGSRAKLIDALCKLGAKNPATCMQAYGPLTTPVVRTPRDFLRAVDAIAPAGSSSAPVEAMMKRLVPEATRAFRQNVSYETLAVLLAAGRCPPPTGTPDDDERFARCAAAILDRRLMEIPAPDAPSAGRD